MNESHSVLEQAADKAAFNLLREAYFDLAHTLLRIEEEPARELLRSVEQRTALKLTNFDALESASDAEILAMAGPSVCAVLKDAQEATEGTTQH